MTTAEQSSGTHDFVSSYAEGAGLPGTENTVTGAAMHRDLYRKPEDPAAVRKRDAGQARVLGLGFMVFFCVFLGGISMWLNGALYGHAANFKGIEEPVAGVFLLEEEEPSEGRDDALGARLGAASAFRLVWSDESTSALELIYGDEEPNPKGKMVVHVGVNREWTTRAVCDDKTGAEPVAIEVVGAVPGDAKDLPTKATVRPGKSHAWNEAELMGLVYTRCVIYLGLVLGALGLFVPVVLVPFYKVWMRFVTAPLGFVNTRLILGIVYFLVLTPMAILLKIFSTDRLRREALPQGESYWVNREKQRDHKHFEKGF